MISFAPVRAAQPLNTDTRLRNQLNGLSERIEKMDVRKDIQKLSKDDDLFREFRERFRPEPVRFPEQDCLFKVIIIGDTGVGKSAFVSRYVFQTFLKNYKSTIGVDFALKIVKWSDNLTVKLQLWDIAGQERFWSMTRVYYKDAHACIIVFDLTHRASFVNSLKWKQDLDSKCTLPDGSTIPCLLLANKCDLPHREVQYDEIEAFCKEHDFIGWTEISVKDNVMVDECMKFLMKKLMTLYVEDDQDGLLELDKRSGETDTIRLAGQVPEKTRPRCPCTS